MFRVWFAVVILLTAIAAPFGLRCGADEPASGEVERLGGTPFYIPGIRAVAYSPDGKLLAACGNFYGVKVFDAETGQLIKQLETSRNQLGEIFFTSDGKRLAAGGLSWSVGDWAGPQQLPADATTYQRAAAWSRLRGKRYKVGFRPPAALLQDVTGDEPQDVLELLVGARNTARVISDDEKLFAVAGVNQERKDGRIEVWDVESRKKRFEFAAGGNLCWRMCFTPDSKHLLAAFYYDDTIHQWNLETGEEGPPIPSKTKGDMLPSPDGRLLAVYSDTGTQLFQRATGKLLVQLPTREIAVPRVFSPDGKRLVTTSGSLVQVFDVATGARLFPSNKPRILPTRYYALSADGKRLAALYHPPRCVLWDVSTSEVVREWTPANYVGRVAFSPNEDYVAVGRIGVQLFAVNDDAANPLVFPPKRAAAPYLAVTSPDGAAMAEVEPSGLIRIRSFVTPPDRARQTTLALTGHVGGVTALAFSLDGDHLASCGADNTICIWSMETGKRVHKIQLARPARRCVALSPDASRVATAVGDRLQVWSTAAGELETGMVVEGEPRCIEFSPDGKWLTSASDTGELRVFNAADGKLVAHALASEQPVTVMRYSADGESILVGRQDGAVEVWNAADLKQKARWTDLKSRVRSIALLAGSSRMAAGDAAGSVAVWDLNNHQRLNHATRIGVGMRHLAFSADGMQLRCCSNRTYASVDLATNKRAGAIVGVSSTGEKRPLDYAFAPDGKTLATALPSALELWEIESGQRVEILPTPEDCSATLAFSPHGDILAAARQGIIIWRPAGDAEPIFINKSACGETLSLTFSPDGRVLASGGREKAVKLWDTTTGSLLHTLPVKRENHDGQLAFTADGRVLLGYDRDFDQPKGRQTYLMMWETATGRLLAEHNIPMDVYAFDRHGRRLITTAENGAYLVRNLEPYHHQALRPAADDPIQLEALWSRLAEEDPQVAYRAIGALAARGTEAIELINDRLRPIAEAKETQAADITALVEQVATGDLADRRKASSKLRRLGPAAFPELRRTLNTKDDLSAAARGRIEILLAAQRPDRSSEQLRTIRAIHVLERIGSQQARHVLKKLAAGAKDAFRTEQARQVLSRLP